MDLHLGDVVLIEVHFHQTHGAKIRPAVVVLDSGDEDFMAAPITTRGRNAELDVNLAGWQIAGLNVPSIARVNKVAVLAKAKIRRLLGRLSADDLASLRAALCRVFCPASE